MVTVPAFSEKIRLQAPTGTVLEFELKRKVNRPETPAPSACLQICARPMGIGVAVGVQFGEQPGVGVGVRVGLGVGVLAGVELVTGRFL